MSKTTPLLGMICHLFGQTSPVLQSLRALASAIPDIWMGHALVSRNSATTSHLKTKSPGPIVWHYLQTDGQTDGPTHVDGMYRA